jgi:N-methylhydantoinase A/oxoprolinase/acetone carboxylase beta subunit
MELKDFDRHALARIVGDQTEAVRATLKTHTSATITLRTFYECQFRHQSHSIEVEGAPEITGERLNELFRMRYAETFGHLAPEAAILIRRVRVEGRCVRDIIDGRATGVTSMVPTGDAERPRGSYWRPDLQPDAIVKGPATIASTDASIYVPPETVATVVDHGHIVVDV